MRRISAQAFDCRLPCAVAETLLRCTPNAEPTQQQPPTLPRQRQQHATVTADGGVASLADRSGGRWAAEARAAAEEEDAPESAFHCDESLAPHFHFSTVLWLNEAGRDFDGGELAFLHNRSWAWLLVEPAAGRGVVFSSGWENVHGIKPLRKFGARWAFSVPLMVNDELNRPPATAADGSDVGDDARAASERDRRFHERCVRPADKHAYQHCRADWASAMSRPSSPNS